MKTQLQPRRSKRGAALVEYGLIVAGVALVAVAAVSIFGHKTAGMIGTSAGVLPGATAEDNAPIQAGAVVKTRNGGIDQDALTDPDNTIGSNIGIGDAEVITDPQNQ